MATALRTLLRLDPEVIFIGEMRDRTTAEIALQAALTGQLVLTTFHAGDSREAVSRLFDLGIPHYAVRNAIRLVVAQRLVRRLCACAQPGDVERDAGLLGIRVGRCSVPGACEACHQSGYRGRSLIAECRTWPPNREELELVGGSDLWANARALIESGITDAAEVVRVLGLPRS
jgi:type II secretory ATPase GspE/PulE/Tfp pilus assembly ATPase PilB-like protein